MTVERASQHPFRFAWPARLAALLGRLPDADVAARAKVTAATVSAERRRRGIPAFNKHRPRIKWTGEMLALLGTDSDYSVAHLLEVHPASVRLRRVALGIPAFYTGGGPPGFKWTARCLGLLGRQSDRRVAKRLGVTVTTVWAKRQALDIPSCHRVPPPFRWSRQSLALLGRQPDTEVARRLGIHPSTVMRKREQLALAPGGGRVRPIVRTQALKKLLRMLSNRELNEEHGLSSFVIAKLRREYGVPTPRARRKVWTDPMVARLGKESDRGIARELGVVPSAVHKKRSSLGIPRFVPSRR